MATDDQQAALGTSTDGLLGSDNIAGTACTDSAKPKSATLECDSPVVSPCLNPSTASFDGIEYLNLDLNENEMDKWPGVDPESRYQSALNYKIM